MYCVIGQYVGFSQIRSKIHRKPQPDTILHRHMHTHALMHMHAHTCMRAHILGRGDIYSIRTLIMKGYHVPVLPWKHFCTDSYRDRYIL